MAARQEAYALVLSGALWFLCLIHNGTGHVALPSGDRTTFVVHDRLGTKALGLVSCSHQHLPTGVADLAENMLQGETSQDGSCNEVSTIKAGGNQKDGKDSSHVARSRLRFTKDCIYACAHGRGATGPDE